MLSNKGLIITLISCMLAMNLQSALALQCYKCDSTDANCLEDVTKVTGSDTCVDTINLCVTQLDGTGKITRGCKTDNTACTTDTCVSCSGDKCNTHTVCKSCDSSTNPSCAQTSATDLSNAICKASDTKCLKNINTDKQTIRRCATDDDVKSCTNTATCELCTGGNCNTGIFPMNRVRCYQCDAATDSKCNNLAANTDILSQPCKLYDAADKCYTYGTSATTMLHGCVSDKAETNKCATPETNELCSTCAQDNCNNNDYMVDQKLMCIKCTSSKEDTKCMWGQPASDALNCVNKVQYNKPQQCYTQSKDDIVYRGCIVDRDATKLGECNTENKCDICSDTNGCNNKDNADFTCIRCRSDNDEGCWKKAKEMGGGACRNPVTQAESKCFTGIWDDILIRGCLVDADERMKAVCNDNNNKQCDICDNKNCNTEEKSGATTVTVTTGVLAVVLLALFY